MRRFLAFAAVLPLLAACAEGGRSYAPTSPAPAVTQAAAAADKSAEAPSCSGRPTPAQTEGPYFKSGSPERASLLESGLPGGQLLLSGRVFDVQCRPLSGVVLDFWQADASGRYDNAGYRLRGHQSTTADGRYTLRTVIPGEYPGRTEHIHVKVAAPGKPVLTTQLYFPGVARNSSDSIFDPALLIRLDDGAPTRGGAFDFVSPS
ncbi:MAG TPA: dioxygenase [Candidatus Dormibacteraeota bacterium]|nr:dioxygenase [Candidatus Dormibacteraeota bacterium]